MVALLAFGLVDVVDGGREREHNVIAVYFFLLIELEFGDGEAEEEDLLLAGNACDVLQSLVDEGVEVGLEPLVLQQLLRRVLLGTEVDDLNDPDGRKGRF